VQRREQKKVRLLAHVLFAHAKSVVRLRHLSSRTRASSREQLRWYAFSLFPARLSEVHQTQRIRSHVAGSNWPMEDFLVVRVSERARVQLI